MRLSTFISSGHLQGYKKCKTSFWKSLLFERNIHINAMSLQSIQISKHCRTMDYQKPLFYVLVSGDIDKNGILTFITRPGTVSAFSILWLLAHEFIFVKQHGIFALVLIQAETKLGHHLTTVVEHGAALGVEELQTRHSRAKHFSSL